MVAAEDRADTIRTQRLEITDDEGRVQIVLEAGDDGPTFTMLDPESGTPRLKLRAHPDGASFLLFSQLACNGGDGMVDINVHGDRSALTLFGIDGEGTSACPSPRVQAESLGLRNDGGRIVVYDKNLDIVFEEPQTVESLQDRLRDRLIAAVADEVTDDELRRFGRGELLDAIGFAIEGVVGGFERALSEPATGGSVADAPTAG